VNFSFLEENFTVPWPVVSYRFTSFHFLPIRSDSFWFVPIRSDSFWFVPIRSDSFWFVLIRSDSFRFVPIRSDSFRFVPIRSDSFRFVLIRSDSFRFVPDRFNRLSMWPSFTVTVIFHPRDLDSDRFHSLFNLFVHLRRLFFFNKSMKRKFY
jgi:hypothetical protein